MAQSASVKFSPTDRPTVAVAADGSLAAIHERTRIVVTDLPSCAQLSELGIDANATETSHAWVGTPPRLLVLSRYDSHSTLYLVDPFGPRTIAELRLDTPMRLSAAVGNHALAIGPQGAAVFAATDRDLTPFQFPARVIPVTAGAAGTQFVVALPGAIEEWDPQTRLPKRRLKLSRPAQVTAIGGSDRVVWLTTQQEPARIDVLPLVDRGQPKQHDLPEPIARVASHPRSDLIACIGATSGRIWVIDLDGRAGLRMVGPEGIDRAEDVALVVGRVAGLLAAQTARPLTVVTLERHDEQPVAAPVLPRTRTRDTASTPAAADAHDDAPNTSVTLGAPSSAPVARTAARSTPPPIRDAPVAAPTPAGHVDNAVLASFRDRLASSRACTVEPSTPLWPTSAPGWRDEIAAWTREVVMTEQLRVAPASLPIDTLLARYQLTPSLGAALVLLYGAHLLGANGVAPVDVARVSGWPEALGRGELADQQVAVYDASRVALAPALRRVLDELAPRTGSIVGSPGATSLVGPCVIVSGGPLRIIAEACVSSIGGAILAGHDDADARELVAEARAYGATAMMRMTTAALAAVPLEQPLILVVDDDVTANQLGLPRLR